MQRVHMHHVVHPSACASILAIASYCCVGGLWSPATNGQSCKALAEEGALSGRAEAHATTQRITSSARRHEKCHCILLCDTKGARRLDIGLTNYKSIL